MATPSRWHTRARGGATEQAAGPARAPRSWPSASALAEENWRTTEQAAPRGYQLLELSSSVQLRQLRMDSSGYVRIQPSSSSVKINLNFPLQSSYSSITLVEKQPLSQLFSSILGLTGLFSLFAYAFQAAEWVLGPEDDALGVAQRRVLGCSCHRRCRRAWAPPSEQLAKAPPLPLPPADQQQFVMTANPIAK